MKPFLLMLIFWSPVLCSAQTLEQKQEQTAPLISPDVGTPVGRVRTDPLRSTEVIEQKGDGLGITGGNIALLGLIIGAVSGSITAGINLWIARLTHRKDRDIVEINNAKDLALARLNWEKERELANIAAKQEMEKFEQSQLQSRENLRRDAAKELALELWRIEITKEHKGAGVRISNDGLLGNFYSRIFDSITSVERQHSKRP